MIHCYALTHWPLWDLEETFKIPFSMLFYRLVSSYESGYWGSAVLLPDFAINWWQNQVPGLPHHRDANDSFFWKLDESTARRQLKSPRSLSGRSIHLTLVTKWSWSWMTYCHPICAMSIGPPLLRYSYFKIWPWVSMVKVMCVVKGQGHVWPWKFKGQVYGQGQTWWSYLRPWSSIDMFAFHFVAIGPFLAEIYQILYLTLKIQGQGHGKGQTQWSHLSPRVPSLCLLFVSWQSEHFWPRYSKFHIWTWKI